MADTNDNKWEPILEAKIADAQSRGSYKRNWIKLSVDWLNSSINYRMELSEQAVYSKLLCMAEKFGPVPGLISDNDCRAMKLEYLAECAHCPLDILKSTIQKGIEDDSIFVNRHGIFLTHFDDYQFTEYDRQRKYRQVKRHGVKDKSSEELEAENQKRVAAYEAAHKQ